MRTVGKPWPGRRQTPSPRTLLTNGQPHSASPCRKHPSGCLSGTAHTSGHQTGGEEKAFYGTEHLLTDTGGGAGPDYPSVPLMRSWAWAIILKWLVGHLPGHRFLSTQELPDGLLRPRKEDGQGLVSHCDRQECSTSPEQNLCYRQGGPTNTCGLGPLGLPLALNTEKQ